MSAYITVQTQLVSARHLKQALESMGFTAVELHDTPQPLVAFNGTQLAQRAEVIVRRKHLSSTSNDLGFTRDGSGRLQALISDVDRLRFDTTWLMQLNQRYAYLVAREQLTQQGFDLVNEEVDAGKTIRLTLRRVA